MALSENFAKEALSVEQEALRSAAGKLALIKQTMAQELANAQQQITEISAKYQGKISRENIKKFEDYSLEFNNFCAKVDQYYDFLMKTADAYDAADDGNASSGQLHHISE
jgi:uncharacterized protein YukE